MTSLRSFGPALQALNSNFVASLWNSVRGARCVCARIGRITAGYLKMRGQNGNNVWMARPHTAVGRERQNEVCVCVCGRRPMCIVIPCPVSCAECKRVCDWAPIVRLLRPKSLLSLELSWQADYCRPHWEHFQISKVVRQVSFSPRCHVGTGDKSVLDPLKCSFSSMFVTTVEPFISSPLGGFCFCSQPQLNGKSCPSRL